MVMVPAPEITNVPVLLTRVVKTPPTENLVMLRASRSASLSLFNRLLVPLRVTIALSSLTARVSLAATGALFGTNKLFSALSTRSDDEPTLATVMLPWLPSLVLLISGLAPPL